MERTAESKTSPASPESLGSSDSDGIAVPDPGVQVFIRTEADLPLLNLTTQGTVAANVLATIKIQVAQGIATNTYRLAFRPSTGAKLAQVIYGPGTTFLGGIVATTKDARNAPSSFVVSTDPSRLAVETDFGDIQTLAEDGICGAISAMYSLRKLDAVPAEFAQHPYVWSGIKTYWNAAFVAWAKAFDTDGKPGMSWAEHAAVHTAGNRTKPCVGFEWTEVEDDFNMSLNLSHFIERYFEGDRQYDCALMTSNPATDDEEEFGHVEHLAQMWVSDDGDVNFLTQNGFTQGNHSTTVPFLSNGMNTYKYRPAKDGAPGSCWLNSVSDQVPPETVQGMQFKMIAIQCCEKN